MANCSAIGTTSSVKGEIVRGLLQIICVVAFGLGTALFATGGYLRPRLDPADPAAVVRYLDRGNSEERIITAVVTGFGVGLMVLGGLGLTVPWVNAIVSRTRKPGVLPAEVGSCDMRRETC